MKFNNVTKALDVIVLLHVFRNSRYWRSHCVLFDKIEILHLKSISRGIGSPPSEASFLQRLFY